MKRIKHSKVKNTGLIFELLVRQVASDTMNNRDSKALNVIKSQFNPKSELSKELKQIATDNPLDVEKYNTLAEEYKTKWSNKIRCYVKISRRKTRNITSNK